MSSLGPDARQALLAQLQAELTQTIADGVLFQQAVADRLGLGLSDFKCLTALSGHEHATAGDIAAQTGLTTGAVTRMIDRLERSGWVYREHDQHDRRRVIVRPVAERQTEIWPLFEGMTNAWAEALADYDDDHITMILDLFSRMRKVAREQATLLHQPPPDHTPRQQARQKPANSSRDPSHAPNRQTSKRS